jgi:hypothetical protein
VAGTAGGRDGIPRHPQPDQPARPGTQHGERAAARVDDHGVAGADADLPPLLAGHAVTGRVDPEEQFGPGARLRLAALAHPAEPPGQHRGAGQPPLDQVDPWRAVRQRHDRQQPSLAQLAQRPVPRRLGEMPRAERQRRRVRAGHSRSSAATGETPAVTA